MGAFELPALFLVALLAGGINALAGGGSLISFPALIAAGLPAKQANVTNTAAVVPGLAAVTFGYRRELEGEVPRLSFLVVPSVAGAALGAILLLSTPSDTFRNIVPFLIFFATAMIAFQDSIGRWALRHKLSTRGSDVPIALTVAAFVLGVYNGYFGAGYGLVMLPVIAIALNVSMLTSQAMRAALSVACNLMAFAVFALFGPVAWGMAAVLAAGFIIGGYGGTLFARAIPPMLLRGLLVAYGLGTGIALLVTSFD